MQLFDRLAGLETEYALRMPSDSESGPPPRYTFYSALVGQLRRRLPLVRARHCKEGVFLATGGAVWFEAERPSAGGGLIEGSTPECRGPLQLLACQRGQDRLLSAAAADADFVLVKNCRDRDDHIYGAQESYEVEIASGASLWLWRLGLVLLLPLLVLTWLGFLLMIAGMLAYLAIAGLMFIPLQAVSRQPRRLARQLFGDDMVEGRETGRPLPPWLEATVLWATRVVTAPCAAALLLLASATAFRRTRRLLTPFLMSRCIISGAGLVDRHGNFQLSDKAPAMNCLVGFGGFLNDRPVYTMGHFFKAACVEACFAPWEYCDLFRRRQRLQIALGDSNMAQLAEYLRIGTTMLVLDAIEAGFLKNSRRLARPIEALHGYCLDPSLHCAAPVQGGGTVTALELQREYFRACSLFVQRQQNVPNQAWDVLRCWGEVLDELELWQATGHSPEMLLGGIDWVTKRYLVEQAGASASWHVRKKIDIRYHELSDEGYFEQVWRAELGKRILDDSMIERCMRTPPPDSPATTRGHYIREFSSDAKDMSANWKRIVFGRSYPARNVVLTRYARRRPLAAHHHHMSEEGRKRKTEG